MMHRMETIAAAVIAASLFSSDLQAAREDRDTYPVADHGYLYYVTTSTALPAQRDSLEAAIRLMVASTSRQPILERCTPQPITETCFRLDLRELRWDWRQWHRHVISQYPYSSLDLPMMLRADWLLVQLADSHESDAYQSLLFGRQTPQTRDQWLSRLGVGADASLRFGLVEGQSGVSKQRIRWIENWPIQRGYAWGTRDVLAVEDEADPLAHLAGDFQHDGEEWIVGIPKVSLETGERGALQVYALAAGDGTLVDRAPVDLVEDHTEFRGFREIRAAGSCIQCHGTGINDPSTNELRELIAAGGDIYAYPQAKAEQIEQFHLGDLTTEIERNQEDYATAVRIVCGCTTQEASLHFKRAVDAYDANVSPEIAAYELGVSVEQLTLAIAYYSAHYPQTPTRMVSLAQGLSIPREAFAEQYLRLRYAIKSWRDD